MVPIQCLPNQLPQEHRQDYDQRLTSSDVALCHRSALRSRTVVGTGRPNGCATRLRIMETGETTCNNAIVETPEKPLLWIVLGRVLCFSGTLTPVPRNTRGGLCLCKTRTATDPIWENNSFDSKETKRDFSPFCKETQKWLKSDILTPNVTQKWLLGLKKTPFSHFWVSLHQGEKVSI